MLSVSDAGSDINGDYRCQHVDYKGDQEFYRVSDDARRIFYSPNMEAWWFWDVSHPCFLAP